MAHCTLSVASLLNCLHQLKSENRRLEDYIHKLVSRRDHLLAINARLSLPFTSPSDTMRTNEVASSGDDTNEEINVTVSILLKPIFDEWIPHYYQ